jgi:curved DNA-binding protein CbpA
MAVLSDSRGFYRLLGVSPTASNDEIRSAFRELAKLYHPDSGNPDQDHFRRLREAYEVLRDPQRRLRYDAEELDAERRRDQARRGAAAAGWAGLLTDRPRLVRLGLLGTCGALLLALIAVSAALAGRGGEAERLRAEVAQLRRQLDSARAAPAQAADGRQAVYTASIAFPPGSAELDGDLRAQLDARINELRAAVQALPPGQGWAVLVDGYSGRAATGEGVTVEAWELALLRIATVTDVLARSSVPPERLGVRFLAGFAPSDAGADEARTIELRLLCCQL